MSAMTAPDREQVSIAVVGGGRMGGNHVRTCARLERARLVAVVDPDMDKAETLADEYGGEPLPRVEALLERFPDLQAAAIAAPTRYHLATARPLLERGVACLIEKPLAPTAAEARELAELANQHGAIVQVGHTERFNPAVKAVRNLGVTPRFIDGDRVAPMSFRSLDVGVVMDLMIHDLDIVLMLVQSPLESVDAVGVSVIGEHEDVCSARLRFASGCVVNMTASRLALGPLRKMRLFSESAYVVLDFMDRKASIISLDAHAQMLDEVRGEIRSGKDLSAIDYASVVNVQQLEMGEEAGGASRDQLTMQLDSFLDAATGRCECQVPVGAGVAAVEAAERVIESLRSHRWQGLPPKPLLDDA